MSVSVGILRLWALEYNAACSHALGESCERCDNLILLLVRVRTETLRLRQRVQDPGELARIILTLTGSDVEERATAILEGWPTECP